MLTVILTAAMLMPSLNTEAKIIFRKAVKCTTCNDTKKCQTCNGTGLTEEAQKDLDELNKKLSEEIKNSKIKLSRNDYNGMIKTSHGQHKEDRKSVV